MSMLKVTLGAGDAASTLMSGRSSLGLSDLFIGGLPAAEMTKWQRQLPAYNQTAIRQAVL